MDIQRVLIADAIDALLIDGLKNAGISVEYDKTISADKILETIGQFDAVVIRSRSKISREMLEAGRGRLKLVARAGVGVDNVDVKAATERQVLVINSPNGNTVSACELTCAHMLSMSRHMYSAMDSLKAGTWNRNFMGCEVSGKSLGIVGLGRIGCEVGLRMKAFGMHVLGYDPITARERVEELGFEYSSLEDIWARADYITVHVPLLDSTRYLINGQTLAKCKQGVKILNCSRGQIVNEEELLAALKSGQVSAAALDVYEQEPPASNRQELLKHPNMYPTPHLGASTSDAQRRVAEEILAQMLSLKRGEPIVGAVNGAQLGR